MKAKRRLKLASAIILTVLLISQISPARFAFAEEKTAIKIAVIDSGVAEKNSVLDYSKILEGKSYVDNEESYTDKIGHGTAIVSIIQEYCPEALIVPLMYHTRYASGLPKNGGIKAICEAIYDAVDNYQCKIINISSGAACENSELEEAVKYAESKDVIVISAVGNDNKIEGGRIFYPAAYETVIGVGAVDSKLEVAGFSQRNSSVAVVMSGVKVKAAGIKNAESYIEVSGTSYAAAAAFCGIAAEIVSQYPDMTAEQFRELIKISCLDLGEKGYDTSYGYGFPERELLKENLKQIDIENKDIKSEN